MLVDTAHIGRELPIVSATVNDERVRAFRRVCKSSDPKSVVAPPTYLFALEMLNADSPMAMVEDLGIDIANVLHGEQSFTYHRPIVAGDELEFRTVVRDITEKKGGAMVVVQQDTKVTDASDQLVAELSRTFVVQQRKA